MEGVKQNILTKNVSSETALSNYDQYSSQSDQEKESLILNNEEYNDTLNSLSYNPTITDNITPTGILKKQKLDIDEGENNNKRFCCGKIIGKLMLIREKSSKELIVLFEICRFESRESNEEYDIEKCELMCRKFIKSSKCIMFG